MKIKNKVLILMLCISTVFMSLFAFPTFASTTGATAWFFKRTKDHTQPLLDCRLSFINNYDCVYVDKEHGDNCQEKVIYLTFDAGYENGNVEKILDVMKRQDVKGTFFILENLIVRNKELVLRMADEGHLVANHTARHKDMSRITEIETFKKELNKLENIYKDNIGREMAKIYRPPEGRFSELNLKHATELGYKTVFWSFAYADWDNKAQMNETEAKEKILSSIHNGAILLLHPTSETNANIMEDVIIELKKQGYRFDTVDKIP